MKDILRNTILKNYKRFSGKSFDRKKELIEEIESLNNKMSIARDKLLSDKIDDEDYRLVNLNVKKELRNSKNNLIGVEPQLKLLIPVLRKRYHLLKISHHYIKRGVLKQKDQ
jgi:hypothetical protein